MGGGGDGAWGWGWGEGHSARTEHAAHLTAGWEAGGGRGEGEIYCTKGEGREEGGKVN